MPSSLTIYIPVGTVAALLTALEYIIGTLAALSARAALHGLWLLSLHRGGELALHARTRQKRSLWKDALGSLLGVWLVLGVALVESNLRTGFAINEHAVASSSCVSVYGRYFPQRIAHNQPPYAAGVEPWIFKIATSLRCFDRGIATVGVGGLTDPQGTLQNTTAPVCANAPQPLAPVVAHLGPLRVTRMALEPMLSRSDAFVIFPLNATRLGKGIAHIGASSEGTGPCGIRGISAFPTRVPSSYETVHVQSENMTRAVLEAVCTQHGARAVPVLPDPVVAACAPAPGVLEAACLGARARRDETFTAELADVSALFVGSNVAAPSYACTTVTIRLEYVFIPPAAVTRAHHRAYARLPVLLPTRAAAVAGHCERTVPPLGQAALLYSADAAWSNSAMARLPPRERYYAYMMAVSASMFPLNTVRGEESPLADGECRVRPVRAVTEIAVDWRLFVLATGFCTANAVIVMGIALRAWFVRAWDVGSAQWSLERLMERTGDFEDGKAEFEEVVIVRPLENSRWGRNRMREDEDISPAEDESDDGRRTWGSRAFVNAVASSPAVMYDFEVRSVAARRKQRLKERSNKEKGDGANSDTEDGGERG